MRAPIGGLFRHVVDLAGAQAARGHLVGLIADSSTGGARAQAALEALEPSLALGVTRLKMPRLPGWSDAIVACKVAGLVAELEPDVIHGHGAKGGLYARLPALLPLYPQPRRRVVRVYTPHGGSLHYHPNSLAGRIYLGAERALAKVTDLIPFESEYARSRFIAAAGPTNAASIVVPNGIGPNEFEPVQASEGAADFLYVGELRKLKGVDTLIAALGVIRAHGRQFRLVLVGSGPDEKALQSFAETCSVSKQLSFAGPMPARDAFRLGRILVVPSRAESLPYIVLEALGARLPVIATNVGGIPEIFGPKADRLMRSDDPHALARAMIAMSDMDQEERTRLSGELSNHVRANFSLDAMADAITGAYIQVLNSVEERELSARSALVAQT
jgi:glycosyltransferase involved in cell wall biosynthesis